MSAPPDFGFYTRTAELVTVLRVERASLSSSIFINGRPTASLGSPFQPPLLVSIHLSSQAALSIDGLHVSGNTPGEDGVQTKEACSGPQVERCLGVVKEGNEYLGGNGPGKTVKFKMEAFILAYRGAHRRSGWEPGAPVSAEDHRS